MLSLTSVVKCKWKDQFVAGWHIEVSLEMYCFRWFWPQFWNLFKVEKLRIRKKEKKRSNLSNHTHEKKSLCRCLLEPQKTTKENPFGCSVWTETSSYSMNISPHLGLKTNHTNGILSGNSPCRLGTRQERRWCSAFTSSGNPAAQTASRFHHLSEDLGEGFAAQTQGEACIVILAATDTHLVTAEPEGVELSY